MQPTIRSVRRQGTTAQNGTEALPSGVSYRKARPYRVVAVSLYEDEAAADRLADILRAGCWPKANRSLIVREALARLQEDLAGKTPEEIFRYFVDRQAPRAQVKSLGPDTSATDDSRRSTDRSKDK